jgi:hypothetical protein
VGLIEVDRVHPEPVERGVQFLLDGLPREPARVGVVVVHLEVTLRRDDALLAVARQGLAEDALGLAPRVHVRGVEEVDTQVAGAFDEFDPGGLVEDPVAPVA